MFKVASKRISHIEFSPTHTALKATNSGFLIFWVMVAISGILFLGGVILGIVVEPLLIPLIVPLGIPMLMAAFFAPVFEWFEIDQAAKSIKYCSSSMKNRKAPAKAKVKAYPFHTLEINWEAGYLGDSVVVLIKAKDRSRFTLRLPKDQHEALMNWLAGNPIRLHLKKESIVEGAQPLQGEESLPIIEEGFLEQKEARGHATMLNEIASWGRSSLFLGVVHIIASGLLNPAWGVTLIVVGGLSFLFKEAAMFIMYAVTLIWVGISNMLSLEIGLWTFFGAYQVYLGLMLFKKYRLYRDFEKQHLNSLDEIPADYKAGRAEKYFPWTGSLLSGLGLVVYVGVWVAVFLAMVFAYDEAQETITLSDSLWTIFDLVGGIALGLGIVGLGMSISSAASKFKPKFIAWVGVVMGILLVLAEVAIRVWNMLG